MTGEKHVGSRQRHSSFRRQFTTEASHDMVHRATALRGGPLSRRTAGPDEQGVPVRVLAVDHVHYVLVQPCENHRHVNNMIDEEVAGAEERGTSE